LKKSSPGELEILDKVKGWIELRKLSQYLFYVPSGVGEEVFLAAGNGRTLRG
jgi:hypothetical protein